MTAAILCMDSLVILNYPSTAHSINVDKRCFTIFMQIFVDIILAIIIKKDAHNNYIINLSWYVVWSCLLTVKTKRYILCIVRKKFLLQN